MGPIRSLELAHTSDTTGLGQTFMCVCVSVCFSLCRWIVCRYCMGRDN